MYSINMSCCCYEGVLLLLVTDKYFGGQVQNGAMWMLLETFFLAHINTIGFNST